MKIGIYHGYELTGSGSNEYTKYLACTLAQLGNEVHVICLEHFPEKINFISKAFEYDSAGNKKLILDNPDSNIQCILHKLPDADVKPVFLTDKQRTGNVKSFINLTQKELRDYHNLHESVLKAILEELKLDILHANHLVYQPITAIEACKVTNTPLIIYPHGSSIEYVVRLDDRYKELALDSIKECDGLIIGNKEVRDRIVNIYSEYGKFILDKSQIAGVGVDTNLFKPIPKAERNDVISQLKAKQLTGGKKASQSVDLINKLNSGDISATRSYWDQYDHSKPDDDFNAIISHIPWDNNILLFVGALTVGKGLQSLITALPEILSKVSETHLVIVGAGAYREVLEGLVYAISSGNKELLLELCSKGYDLDKNDLSGEWEGVAKYLNNNIDVVLKNGNNLDKHIHFIGRLDHENLKYVFPCSDIAVFPSVVPEAYPLVLMESLSNAVLPVVSYFSGFKDGVDELEQFLGREIVDKMKISVCPEDRISTIINNICYLLNNYNFNANSNKLRSIAVNNYDWKIRAGELIEAYKKVIND